MNLQRGKLRQDELNAMREKHGEKASRMLVIMRLAVVLKWTEDLDELSVRASTTSLSLGLPKAWYEDHPLTTKELVAAGRTIKKLGIRLQFD